MIPRLGLRVTVSLALVPIALTIGGCGSGSSSGDSSSTVLQGKEGRPDVPVSEGQAPSKLVVLDLKKGSGTTVAEGADMSVRYFRFGYADRQILEDHWRGRPETFTVGSGQVIFAWERGLLGMKAGGRRELILPAKMASTKAPEVYVVDAISVSHPKPSPQAGRIEIVTPTGAKPSIVAPGPPPRDFVVRTLKHGSGGRVRRGDRIGARFMDFNYRSKRVQDFWGDRETEPVPYHFILGQGRVRKGWEIAIPGQRLGTRLELLLPSRLAYGDGPRRYVVELIERETPTADGEG